MNKPSKTRTPPMEPQKRPRRPPELYQVAIECPDEQQQRELFQRLSELTEAQAVLSFSLGDEASHRFSIAPLGHSLARDQELAANPFPKYRRPAASTDYSGT